MPNFTDTWEPSESKRLRGQVNAALVFHSRPVASLPEGGGGGVRWRPKRGPSWVVWCVCVGRGEGITIVSVPGGVPQTPPGYGPA